MNDRRCFVQFMHPGGEHHPDRGDFKLWNQGCHQRKFMKSKGRYGVGDAVVDGEIVFWGEWEPESRLVQRYRSVVPDSPSYLYAPYYVEHEGAGQNTDPFVFGDQFLYTGCLQHTFKGPTQLRHLDRGSVILFGSCRRGHFAIDTVFVVADHVDHTMSDWRQKLDGRISPTYAAVTLDQWYKDPRSAGRSHRLYFGATWENRVEGMFSFFPCDPWRESESGFARPEVRIDGHVTPTKRQGYKGTSRELDQREIVNLWLDVKHQVIQAGLALGVYAELPHAEPLNGPNWAPSS